MWYRVTRTPDIGCVAGTVVPRSINIAQQERLGGDELVGYVEADRDSEAIFEARTEYGDEVHVQRITGYPEDDIWPPESHRWRTQESRDAEGQEFYGILMDALDSDA